MPDLNPKEMTPGDWGAALAVVSAVSAGMWFMLKPFIVWWHRKIGKQAFATELKAHHAITSSVEEMRTRDLPRLESLAGRALETAERTEGKIDELNTTLRNMTIQRIGEYRPPHGQTTHD